MKKIFCLLFILLMLPDYSFGQQSNRRRDLSFVYPFQQDPFAIIIELNEKEGAIPTYDLSWESMLSDTLASRNPKYDGKEIQIFIRDKNGLLCFYEGEETPRTSCAFSTSERRVWLYFRIRKRKEYLSPEPREYSNGGLTITAIKPIELLNLDGNCDISEFKKVEYSLEAFGKQQIILENNPEMVSLTHINKGAMYPNNMPQMGCNYDYAFCLSRYYLDLESGRILKGRQWMNRRGVKKIVNDLDLCVIDPSVSYEDRKGKVHIAKALIKKRKIDFTLFDPKVFLKHAGSYPY